MSRPRSIPVAASARSTLGVEWELLLVDRDSGAARQCAAAVLEAVHDEHAGTSGVVGELLQNTVELVTGACTTVREAGEDLTGSLAKVRRAADPMRVDVTSAGTHPFSRWEEQQVSDADRYATLIDRTQWWGRQMTIYGVHVHVGIEDPAKILPITNALLTAAGPLLSLTASSPYWQGESTRYASNRSLLFQQLPTAGLPYQFGSWQEYETYVEDMLTMGVIDQINEIRWDIRPVPVFGTIEVRVADGLPTLREVLALAAYVQCLVEDLSARIDAGEALETLTAWQVAENKWRAARYGMDAILVVGRDNREELIVDHVRAELARLAPVAERLDCVAELAGVEEILTRGASYQRQLAVAAEPGATGRDIVRHLVRETTENALLEPQR
ncbi:glutamate--cysteine ligase [Brachybacterium sp. AOP25-B2-12]|uniref:glutamate--cysteine ligase n=1 Tax=Brachybacterium sp. AOP25-B2-12 TaxID=3457710 RepID=UPI0040337E67